MGWLLIAARKTGLLNSTKGRYGEAADRAAHADKLNCWKRALEMTQEANRALVTVSRII